VKQLLDISWLDANVEPPADHWIDLEAALNELKGNIGRELGAERIAINPSLRGQSLAIDPALFDLAARNLIENALQLSPENGVVRLFLIESGDEAKVCVEDDGPGIPPGEEQLVLQRFFRGRHKSPTGSGLGLPIVAAALDRAGAELRLCRPDGGRGLRAEIVVAAGRLRFAKAA
jgi:two-component system sensor histidine kinase QseC